MPGHSYHQASAWGWGLELASEWGLGSELVLEWVSRLQVAIAPESPAASSRSATCGLECICTPLPDTSPENPPSMRHSAPSWEQMGLIPPLTPPSTAPWLC